MAKTTTDAAKPRSWALTPEQVKERDRKEREEAIAKAKCGLVCQMGTRYAACTLAGYKIDYKEQKAAVQAVQKYLSRLASNVQDGRGLILYGTVGTGKDHMLAAALVNAVDAGMAVSWVNAQAIFEAARDKIDKGGPESAMLRPFVTPLILGISDPTPPASELSGFRIELLWRITDVRYRNKRPIWMTLNAKDLNDAEKKLTAPLWDRLVDGAVVVPCLWPSFRKERA